ncbi:MAG TPA: DUF4340 domain-containing protein [Bryobacteraceae bacterium]|nr:DUF4340 domain-containing protein [Bryobacteraceae bacterium]
MKVSGLTIAAVVLVALVGLLYWSNHRKPEDTVKASADTPPKILSLTDADLSKIAIKKRGADETVLARNGANKWEMSAPKPLPVDQDAVSSMVSSLSSLNSDRLVEDKATDWKEYGLADPSLEVDITKKDGKTTKLEIGDDTPTGSSAYARLEGDPRVFTIASYNKTSIDKGPNDLRDKRLLIVDSDKISRVELVTQTKDKAGDVEFGRDKDQWQIIKPKPLRADGLQVEELVRKVKDAKMDTAVSDEDAKKAAAAFASGTPVATVKVTDSTGTKELQVRKNKDDYYAKSSSVDGVYKVSSELGTGLDKNLDDFRNKKLFEFGFNDPNKIEMHDGAKAYSLTKGGEDWWSNGKKMDVTSVQGFLDKVRDLAASKFVDAGFTSPEVDLTVWSNDNKRVEKVLISKSGDKYIAKRDGEPALYELDAKTVDDLRKAAGDVKPAAAAPSKK